MCHARAASCRLRLTTTTQGSRATYMVFQAANAGYGARVRDEAQRRRNSPTACGGEAVDELVGTHSDAHVLDSSGHQNQLHCSLCIRHGVPCAVPRCFRGSEVHLLASLQRPQKQRGRRFGQASIAALATGIRTTAHISTLIQAHVPVMGAIDDVSRETSRLTREGAYANTGEMSRGPLSMSSGGHEVMLMRTPLCFT